jgi:predicted nucleotide-binding protein (sugar kinase/HSP70/actin superfamily)
VANNKSVVAAFEQVLGFPITVPPNFDVTGAIGAAILARKQLNGSSESRFKGFGMRDVPYTTERFTCQGCSNNCEIRKVRIEGEKKALFYGGRCEKYETGIHKKNGAEIPNLFLKRLELLQRGYQPAHDKGKISIGIPRALMIYYQQFPFWHTFFTELGFNVMVSRATDQKLVTKSLETINAELCLPVELMHGHVADLLLQGADFVFLPFMVDARKPRENPTSNCNCPWIQSHSFMIKAALRTGYPIEKILSPTLHFRYFETAFKGELNSFIRTTFGLSRSRTALALSKADLAQKEFEKDLITTGKEFIQNIPSDYIPVVLLGRPYNTGDPFLNLGVVEKLIKHKLVPVPVDFLELNLQEIFTDYRSMYWPNGQKIIAAARIVAKNPRLYGVYITNFRCGPDSFLMHYVDEELKEKPCLHLEVDEHSADAGMITRIEAFVESLKGYEKNRNKDQKVFRPRPGPS